jgi:LacI family transcriptional regulator
VRRGGGRALDQRDGQQHRAGRPIALGCYDVFRERGVRCPDDVSVIGFNDMPFLDKLQPPLSTIAVPHHQIGVESARMLLESLTERDRPARSVLLPVSLVERSSTAPPHP